MPERSRRYLKAVLEQMRLPYLWGGKGLPGEAYRGRDCSGVVTSALVEAGGPDWRRLDNAQALWLACKPVTDPSPGTLCFYGADEQRVHHVMSWVVDGLVVGAAGGDATTHTLAEALRRGAYVMAWESHLFMSDFRGFRQLPWLAEEGP